MAQRPRIAKGDDWRSPSQSTIENQQSTFEWGSGVPPVEAMELLLNKLKKTQSNVMCLLGMGAG